MAPHATEDVTPTSPRPVTRAWLRQAWLDLAFVHWAVDPAAVAPLLPPGTRPDTLDGATYAGLVAFRLVGTGLPRGPRVPYLGTFLETNVRLYTVDDDGRRAVVFRSMDAERLVPVLAARAALRLPYRWARMRTSRDGDVVAYASASRSPRRAATSLAVRVGAPVEEPTALEHFLTARWGLHTRAWGRTWHVPTDHVAWPLHRAELVHLDDGLLVAAGLPAPTSEPVSVLASPGVQVRFGLPERVGRRAAADGSGTMRG
jgi:uncharacterized protein YqjF (DUF2071 family)